MRKIRKIKKKTGKETFKKQTAKKITAKSVVKAAKKAPLKKKPTLDILPRAEKLKFDFSATGQINSSFGKEEISRSLFTEELPLGYAKDRMVILTRDPRWLYVYWELSRQKASNLGGAAKILRVYDVTQVIFDGTNARSFFDVEIPGQVDNWYIDTRQPSRSWCVELGVRTVDGKFRALLRSNITTTPLNGPSDVTDEEWMIPEAAFARLYGMGLGFGQTSPAGKFWQNKLGPDFFPGMLNSSGGSLVAIPAKKSGKKK
jgi:hypothetical protein